MPNGVIGKLYRAEYEDLTVESLRKDFKHLDLDDKQLRDMVAAMSKEKIYRNDLYQVAIDKNPPHGFAGAIIWWLSIKRTDKEPILDWRDMQAIKNQLCGEEVEMIQLFPAESRLVDGANQWHFFAFMKMGGKRNPRLPLGWTVRYVDDRKPGMGKQRPHDPNVSATGERKDGEG